MNQRLERGPLRAAVLAAVSMTLVFCAPATAGAQRTPRAPAAPSSFAAAARRAAPAQQTTTPSEPDAAQPAPDPPPLTAGWRDGFVVQSADGDFRLQIGLLVQADGRFAAVDADEVVHDTFLMRRLRPNLRGRLWNRFEFYFNPDFAGGAVDIKDAYIDTVFSPAFRIRAGKGTTPFGLERLHSASNLLFYDRALPSSLVPNRDIGVQVLGDLRGRTVSYMAGLMNGVADGASSDVDASDGKDVAGRLVVRPFTRNTGSRLRGLGVAMAGTRGRQAGAAALPSFRTPSFQQPYFSYSGASADGVRTRYSPQVFYYYRTFGALGEYVRSRTPIRRGTVSEEIGHDAWQVAGSIVLTGEAATDTGVRPRANFDFGDGHWGALQMAARYHALRVDERAVALNLAAVGASRKAEGWTVGVNWFLTPNFKYVFNVERTVFDDGAEGARRPENALVFRTQMNF